MFETNEPVKFVHDGKTYDTSTATAVAVHRGAYSPSADSPHFPAQQVRFENTLYRTQRGALFIHEHSTAKFQKGRPVVEDRIRPVDHAVAVGWIATTGAAVLDAEGLELPPEA